MFFFTIFAILGVSLWSGKVYYRCRMSPYPLAGVWAVDEGDTRLCSDVRECELNRYCGSLAEAQRSKDPKMKLKPGTNINEDTDIEDLNYSFSSFNHLPLAFLTIFQCITLEGWIDITNIYEDAYNPKFVINYFLLCIIVCSFFVLNLTIAVMLLKYEEFDKSEKDDDEFSEMNVYGEEIGLPFQFVDFIIEQDNLSIS